MFELTVEAEFAAAHALRIAGTPEPTHGHNWKVKVTIAGPSLDSDGLLCDFHTIEEALHLIVGRFHNRNLNETTPFDRVNPTAELVAKHIADSLIPMMPAEAGLVSVRVTEAPGCAATYKP
jgi:6-pyruvoyltetrahydropterin/6-carboxytetrahydropterin synthase